MSSLLQLFTRQGAFFVFAALELVCFYLIITYNTAQGEVYDATKKMYSRQIMERTSNVRNYLRLEQLNDQLREENADLLSRQPNAYYAEALESDTIQDDSLRQRYTYIAGEVINKSPLSGNITYVINRGYIHGVEPHLGVVNAQGIIGIITQVSERHSRVMSITHTKVQVSAGLRGQNYFGSLRWDGKDTRFATLFDIPKYVQVDINDTIETTGFSNVFPTGVPIGKVKEKYEDTSKSTHIIKVELFNELFNINDAYIVRDLMKEDLDQLDKQE
jgi:rod shape-determining protein MreC